MFVNILHFFECIIKVVDSECARGFPKVFAEIFVLEFLMHVVPKMTEAIPVGTMWKHSLNTLNESLLTIRENGEDAGDKVRDSMSLDNLVQLSDKPEPVVVILSVNNCIS